MAAETDVSVETMSEAERKQQQRVLDGPEGGDES